MDGDNAVIVKTTLGLLKGKLVNAGDVKYYSFTKVPYATPPLGNLRFAPPAQLEPWTGIRDGTGEALKIIMRSQMIRYEDLEDCLFMDIYTPDIKPDKPLPIMFWFNTWNTTDPLGPGHLLRQGVIVVICSFRNESFGFLTSLEITAPGNCGLKDLTMALRFIKHNISEFGGNKDNITIFGSGPGGCMVHYMMLSPMTCGLFHRAIAQSGCALSSWSSNQKPLLTAQAVAKELGKKLDDPFEIIDFLRSVPAEDLLSAQKSIDIKMLTDACVEGLTSMCVETEHEGQEAFITKNPVLIIKSGNFHKVPLMMGSNSNEGLSLMFLLGPSLEECLDKLNKDITKIIPLDLKVQRPTRKGNEIAQNIQNFYVGDSVFKKENSLQVIQLLTDQYSRYFINKSIKLQSAMNSSDIFYYVFDYTGDSPAMKEYPYSVGSNQSDEMSNIFNMDFEGVASRNNVLMRMRMVQLWTNFAKYGNPTPDSKDSLLEVQWPAVQQPEKLAFLNIGAELTVGMNPFKDRMKFWDDIYTQTLDSRISACFELTYLK